MHGILNCADLRYMYIFLLISYPFVRFFLMSNKCLCFCCSIKYFCYVNLKKMFNKVLTNVEMKEV